MCFVKGLANSISTYVPNMIHICPNKHNYQLEDLSCMNNYWFDINNSSHFSLVWIQIYLLLKNSLIVHFDSITYQPYAQY